MVEEREDAEMLNFLYNIQNRRKINIFYAVFTKIGLGYIIMGIALFFMWSQGAFVLIMYLFVGHYIYKNKMNYRFYHQDKLYFYHKITEYLSHREEILTPTPMYTILKTKTF